MNPDIRLEAVKIAQTLHQDIDSILASAGKLVHFISGSDAPVGEPTKTPRAAAKKAAAPEQTQSAGQPSAETASPQANTAAAQQPAASTSSKVTIAYEHVKALILKLSGSGPVGRAAALKVLEDHKATKGPELKPEQYESAHAALTAAVAEVIPAAQA